MRTILVTGGAGYIGSHTSLMLLQAGYQVVVVDNLCNGSREALRRIELLAGCKLSAFYEMDVRDSSALDTVFAAHRPDAVIHFAGLKAVGESVADPLRYYDNNVGGSLTLLQSMVRHDVRRIVFSSSATVYGDPPSVPIAEEAPVAPTNPYGRSKQMVEELLFDLCAADQAWRAIILRYFNPVGAHISGQIGEDPAGTPNNLMPYIAQVAVGRRQFLQVFGQDYPTPDGTGVRDYIHVMDLAEGHLHALERVQDLPSPSVINLGTGRGYSVLEVIKAFEVASGRPVAWRAVERRLGDVASCWANPALANRLLGWHARRDLAQMCADAWRWQQKNPQGYGKQSADAGPMG